MNEQRSLTSINDQRYCFVFLSQDLCGSNRPNSKFPILSQLGLSAPSSILSPSKTQPKTSKHAKLIGSACFGDFMG